MSAQRAQFDFKVFNDLTNNQPAGLQLALGINLIANCLWSARRFNNPLAPELDGLVSELTDFKARWKQQANAGRAARGEGATDKQAISAQISRLEKELADCSDADRIETLIKTITKLEALIKATPADRTTSDQGVDHATAPTLGQQDMTLMYEMFKRMMAAEKEGNLIAAQNAQASLEQVQAQEHKAQGDAVQAA